MWWCCCRCVTCENCNGDLAAPEWWVHISGTAASDGNYQLGTYNGLVAGNCEWTDEAGTFFRVLPLGILQVTKDGHRWEYPDCAATQPPIAACDGFDQETGFECCTAGCTTSTIAVSSIIYMPDLDENDQPILDENGELILAAWHDGCVEAECDFCDNNEAPQNFFVRIAGLAGGCESWNGDYFVPFEFLNPGVECRWRLVFDEFNDITVNKVASNDLGVILIIPGIRIDWGGTDPAFSDCMNIDVEFGFPSFDPPLSCPGSDAATALVQSA